MTSIGSGATGNPIFDSRLARQIEASARKNPKAAAEALGALLGLAVLDALVDAMPGGSPAQPGTPAQPAQQSPAQTATPAQMPFPEIDLAGTPAGKGLQTAPKDFPANAVRTAGGYTIVPEGNTNWSIYAPGQKPGDTPQSRIWGDPHVTEKDGTKWDFTRGSDFELPDGTRIGVKTSAEKGYAVSTGLDIVNGEDHVSITNVNAQPTTGKIDHDGYEWRAAHLEANKEEHRDTFHLAGGKDVVNWFKETDGKTEGLVTGAHMDAATGKYEQDLDKNAKMDVAIELRPKMGTEAWGNWVRNMLVDETVTQGLPKEYAQSFGQFMHQSHDQEVATNSIASILKRMFGGLGGQFGNLFRALDTVKVLRNAVLDSQQMEAIAASSRRATVLA